MDDFFDKIKKKLSVDNILDFMKDGKLKEEIKQTLTAKINLNERPKQEEARPPLEVPIALEPKKHVTIENIQHSKAEGQSKILNGVLNGTRLKEEKLLEGTRKQMMVEINQQKIDEVTDEQKKLTKGDTKEQVDDTKAEDKKTENNKIETGNVEAISILNVIQKAPAPQSKPENADPLDNFEIFMG